MKSIILSDASSTEHIFAAVAGFVPILAQNRERMLLKNKMGDMISVSSNPCEMTPDSILLVNSDIALGIRPHLNTSHPVITYGCNPKATVTASSIGETKMVCCIQRVLTLEDMSHILPQEFPFPLNGRPVSACLAAICILLYSFGESILSFEIQE